MHNELDDEIESFETLKPTTRRLFVGPIMQSKVQAEAFYGRPETQRHFWIIPTTWHGKDDDMLLFFFDTEEQRDRALPIWSEVMPSPWPRPGSRARVRAGVEIAERIVEACGWRLLPRERRVLEGLRALVAA